MKIAMVGQKGMPTLWGGIERHVEELSVRLAKQGHTVFAFARKWYSGGSLPLSQRGTKGGFCKNKKNPSPRSGGVLRTPRSLGERVKKGEGRKYRGVNIVFAPTIHTKHLDAIIHSLLSTFKAIRLGVDVIHYHGVGPSLVAWIPRVFAPRIRVISTFHCIDRKHKKWGFAARLFLRLAEWTSCKFAHQTITVSDTLRQYCDEAYDTECAHIPNGVNIVETQNFASLQKTRNPASLRKFGLQKNKYLGFFSRLVPHKNAHLLIAAWKNISKNNPGLTRGMKLAIVGDSSFTDKYVNELKEMTRGDKSIVMTGYQSGSALRQLFAGAKLIAHPSESEGMSIVVLEAMSYGKTVLAADIPENKEALGNCGFYCRRNSLQDLEKKLTYLLKNPRVLKSMGARAQKRVRENFDWDKITEQVEDVYQTKDHAELAIAKT